MSQKEVTVVQAAEEHLPAFKTLNVEWIERYFALEGADFLQLDHPKKYILDPGGQIFFVLENGKAVGTCAMIPHGKDSFELAKMAVTEEVQGKGYGRLLLRKAVDWAKERQAKNIMLLSNTQLTPAISLYKSFGFKTIRLGPHPEYQRGDIEMELVLR